MRKFAITFIILLTAIILTGCPGIGEDLPKEDPVPPALSNNAALSGLTITTGLVDHVYTTIESSYSLTVSNAVDSITVAPILSDAGASLTINGVAIGDISITIPISVGDNTFTLIVTAGDGETTLSYSVVITRLDDSVPDNEAPVITLSGDNPLTIEVNTAYTEPGYSALDSVEGDLTNAIVVTGSVNSSTAGTYTLYYNVSDTSENDAVEVLRTVNVMESLEAPTISLASGTYISAQTVTITHPNPDVDIYYTLDNTWIPDESIGTLYDVAITVSEPTTLITRAFLDGFNPSSGTREDYAIITPGETNMIANGDFSDGLVLWKFYDHSYEGNGEASFSVIGGVFTASITDGGYKDWHVVTYYQPRFLLEQDEYYQLDFTAWAAGERQIEVQLHEEGIDNNGDGSSYSNYYGNTVDLTTSPQQFSFKMSMDEIDDPQASLRFNLGIETADVYLDKISLEKIIPVIVDPLDFPDPELRNALETAVGKPFGDITDMDLATLEELGIEDENCLISDLTGIEYCESLRELYIGSSEVSNYSPLSGLIFLERLCLNDNNLSDISFLYSLTSLRWLDLRNNQITSIVPLTDLTHLVDVQLAENHINDLTPIAGRSELYYLSVHRNPLEIDDLLVLTNFPDLWAIKLDNSYDMGGGTHPLDLNTDFNTLLNILDDFQEMTYLYMDYLGLSDSQFASLYTQVLEPRDLEWTRLNLPNSNVTNASLSLISNLTNLKSLDLNNNDITDLSLLRTMHDNGAFNDEGSGDVNIRDCNLELWSGSPNRIVVDYLINHGVDVDYEDGNNLYGGINFERSMSLTENIRGITHYNNMIFIGNSSNILQVFDTNGVPVIDSRYNTLEGNYITFDSLGNMYTSYDGTTIYRYDSSGVKIGELTGLPSHYSNQRIAIDSNDNILVIWDGSNNAINIKKYSPDLSTELSSRSNIFNDFTHNPYDYSSINAITIDNEDNIYIAVDLDHMVEPDGYDSVIKYSNDLSTVESVVGGDWIFNSPTGLVFDSNNYLYVTNNWHHSIVVLHDNPSINWNSNPSGDYDGLSSSLNHPLAITVDNNSLYIVDSGSTRIAVFSTFSSN